MNTDYFSYTSANNSYCQAPCGATLCEFPPIALGNDPAAFIPWSTSIDVQVHIHGVIEMVKANLVRCLNNETNDLEKVLRSRVYRSRNVESNSYSESI